MTISTFLRICMRCLIFFFSFYSQSFVEVSLSENSIKNVFLWFISLQESTIVDVALRPMKSIVLLHCFSLLIHGLSYVLLPSFSDIMRVIARKQIPSAVKTSILFYLSNNYLILTSNLKKILMLLIMEMILLITLS